MVDYCIQKAFISTGFFSEIFFFSAGMCKDFYYVEDIKLANIIPSLWTDNGGVYCNRISPG